MEKESYVTLATSDFYAYGCIVLGHSLRKSGTQRKLVALVTDDVSWSISETLQSVFDLVERVPKLDLDYTILQDSHPDFSSSLSKIHCWRLTQFSKCVFLNADTLVLQNCDELFEREELSAVPDVGWPDCFNTGVFVFKPNLETYWSLINLIKHKWHRDGGDQYVLNLYFNPDWKSKIEKRLPFIYNLVCSSIYTYAPAFQQFGQRVKIAHFLGHPKPWDSIWNSGANEVTLPSNINFTFQPFHQRWLEIFKDDVFPHLPKSQKHLDLTDNQVIINYPEGTSTSMSQNESVSSIVYHPVSPAYVHHSPDREIPPPSKPKSHFIPSLEHSKHLVPSIQQTPLITNMEKEAAKEVQHYERTTAILTPAWIMHDRKETKTSFSPEQVVEIRSISEQSKERESSHDQKMSIFEQSKGQESSHDQQMSIFEQSKGQESSHDQQMNIFEQTSYDQHIISRMNNKAISSGEINGTSKVIETDEMRLKRWEEGNADYLGQDTFDNIWKRLSSFIEQKPVEGTSGENEEGTQLLSLVETEKITPKSPQLDDVSTTSDDTSKSIEFSPEKSENETADEIKVIQLEKNKLPGYPMDDYTGMHEWEQGRIDYTGKDSSDNILQRLNFLIQHKDYREIIKNPVPLTTY